MKACGLIVEYNPFHHGHVYHIQKAKEVSRADCIIAVMSGSFLQRGEPAIIDKFHRTKAALQSGIDIVLELPYPYAVQSSDLFAKGSVLTLDQLGVSNICFGSESGNVSHFITTFEKYKEKETIYKSTLHHHLKQGTSFPEASKKAYQKIGLTSGQMDLSRPNNILGFSYVKTVLEYCLPIKPLTIKRTSSNYHDESITSEIASATSIRKQLFQENDISPETSAAIPDETITQLKNYKNKAALWHTWENYFPLVHYRVLTMSLEELAQIHGVEEGLEYRIKKTAKTATSFINWMKQIKTKRYTWTRLQRIFAHLLTNTKKADIQSVVSSNSVPYVRVLGLTKNGQAYLHTIKKNMNVPIVFSLAHGHMQPMLAMEEKATHAYYSVVPPNHRALLFKQELQAPIRMK
ncbi:nucleotidyltransferase [Virgibacillus alimentarius]|uniref:tRNA(Met) cytidine acetate ligase n=1 Tax=Virgibacillus alimentarius TaxID=698769 RepID=A0ABS4S3N3_9BACI|nr:MULTISPECIES: nucleotidyltransferase [Virgibacillus]MBP2256097.1 putative nucleotidyltransferase [Virgibacillus alimentarius]HLR66044.1 nucleotidyltransferase [Virgibacillus sp.]